MTTGANVQACLKILQGFGNLPGFFSALLTDIEAFKAELNQKLDIITADLDHLKIEIGEPETGSFNPDPKDPTMSVLQMTVGDEPHTGMLTFSESGAPADGAVASDNPSVATVSLDPTDHATWTLTLASPGVPGVANITYTGTSDPPDAGPVVVEPLILTVVAVPTAETGQFNP